MNDSTNICLPCGLCCDGTLIGFVRLSKTEVHKFKETKDIVDIDGEGFFFQPCSDFCEQCTIYEQRPKKCASFNCGLLNSVEKNETKVHEALQVIATVKQHKKNIERKMETLEYEFKSESFYFKTLELKKYLTRQNLEQTLNTENQELTKEIEQLEQLISLKFNLN